MKQATIVIKGEAVQDVAVPSGVQVVVRGNDVKSEHAKGFDSGADEDGDVYQHMEFVSHEIQEGAQQ